MNNPISPFEKWRLETIPQVGFTPEIRELLAMAFEGGRQSVAEKQEPVAWMNINGDIVSNVHKEEGNKFSVQEIPFSTYTTPLYTHPATWQSLSDDEIDNIWSMNFEFGFRACARAIEQALKEKNHAER